MHLTLCAAAILQDVAIGPGLPVRGNKIAVPANGQKENPWITRIQGFSWVEMGGIEPPSDVVLSGLLRAQFASDFLGPGHAANSWPIRAQSSKSPVHPDDGGKQQWLSK